MRGCLLFQPTATSSAPTKRAHDPHQAVGSLPPPLLRAGPAGQAIAVVAFQHRASDRSESRITALGIRFRTEPTRFGTTGPCKPTVSNTSPYLRFGTRFGTTGSLGQVRCRFSARSAPARRSRGARGARFSGRWPLGVRRLKSETWIRGV